VSINKGEDVKHSATFDFDKSISSDSTVYMDMDALHVSLKRFIPGVRKEGDYILLDRGMTELFVLSLSVQNDFQIELDKAYAVIEQQGITIDTLTKQCGANGVTINKLEQIITKHKATLVDVKASLEKCKKSSFGYNMSVFLKKTIIYVAIAAVGYQGITAIIKK